MNCNNGKTIQYITIITDFFGDLAMLFRRTDNSPVYKNIFLKKQIKKSILSKKY